MRHISNGIAVAVAVALLTGAAAAAAPPSGAPHEVCGGRGRVGRRVHGQVRGERLAGPERDDRQ
jgi:hypothetical protein